MRIERIKVSLKAGLSMLMKPADTTLKDRLLQLRETEKAQSAFRCRLVCGNRSSPRFVHLRDLRVMRI